MLEVIGAGTNAVSSSTDFHTYYMQSSLCAANTTRINVLCPNPEEEQFNDAQRDEQAIRDAECTLVPTFFAQELARRKARRKRTVHYNASYWTQFSVLMYRFLLACWRSPTYNFVRMVVSVVIALIFSSTYADQKYSTDVDVISRVALIYITVMFTGVVGMMTVQPVVFAERPAFYREQFSEIYDVKLYTLAATLVEVPLLFSSCN
jgi:hypothetical protein